jgi:hypothetical protein
MNMIDDCAKFCDDSGAYFIRIAHQIKCGYYLLQFIAESLAFLFLYKILKKFCLSSSTKNAEFKYYCHN